MQDAIALMLGTMVIGIALGFGWTLGARLFDVQSELFDRLTNAVIKKLKKEK